MPTITISRQLGSYGHAVAKVTAELLGYRLVWHEVINQAAQISGSPEAALAAIDELGLLGLCPSPRKCKAYRQAVEKVMHQYAAEGNVVILGRAGQAILRTHPEALHVRIVAPLALRTHRIAAIHHITLEFAQQQIEASDEHRRKFIYQFYKQRWNDPDLYDLSLNTARLSPQAAAGVIVLAMESFQKERALHPSQ